MKKKPMPKGKSLIAKDPKPGTKADKMEDMMSARKKGKRC